MLPNPGGCHGFPQKFLILILFSVFAQQTKNSSMAETAIHSSAEGMGQRPALTAQRAVSQSQITFKTSPTKCSLGGCCLKLARVLAFQ